MLTPREFENRSRLKRVGMYLAMLFAIGVGLAIMVYVVQMQLLGWSLGNASYSTSRSLPTPVQLVLYRSPATVRYWASVGGNADVLFQPWRDFARVNSIRLTEATTLNGLAPSAGDVLVLPSLLALDSAERGAVLAYQAQGGGVLATWATGSRDGEGQWLGWGFLNELAGVSVVAELPKQPAGDVMLMRGQSPVSHRLPAGRSVRLGSVTERPYLFSGAFIAAETSTGSQETSNSGLLLYQEPEQGEANAPLPGRVIVWGAPETTWEYQPDDIRALVTDMLVWLTRQPVVVASDWPDGRPAAQMVAVDAQGDWATAKAWVEQLRAASYPLTLFVPNEEVSVRGDSLRSWLNQIDLGYRGDAASFSARGTPSAQVQRMVDGMVGALRAPTVLAGYLPDGDAVDPAIDQSLYAAGVRYRLGVKADPNSGVPFFQGIPGEKPGQRYVVLPRPVSNQVTAASGDSDTWRARGTLGLTLLKGSEGASDSQSQHNLAMRLNDKSEVQSGVWRASGAEIAHWWNDKERFQIATRPAGARIELDVSVVGTEPFSQGALLVMLPRKGVLPQVRGLKTGMPIPVVEPLDQFRALIRFDTLVPGNYSYQLTF